MSQYWLINILSLSIPFLATFHPRLALHRRWKFWFPAMIITAAVFLFWDAWFTSAQVWSFNEMYTAPARWIGMPVEEWAFFFMIPYACIFTYEAFKKLRPNFRIRQNAAKIISWILIAFWIVGLGISVGKMYTLVCYGLSAAVLMLCLNQFPSILRRFIPVFGILLIPFTIVNGFLTGSFGNTPIVSYDDAHNMGVRFLNIPIEDFSYAFTMLLMTLIFIRFFEELKTEQ